MTTRREKGIQLVYECVAGENAQDYDRMYSVFAPELTYYLNGNLAAKGNPSRFAEAEKRTTPEIYGRTFREIQWIDGNDSRVVMQYRTEFDHNGTIFGFPALGNRIEVHGVAIYEHDGERVHTTRVFADQGEMNRQLSGKLRTPGTVSAAPEGLPIPEAERAQYEEIGERLARKVYQCEASRDLDGWVNCYSNPIVTHGLGRRFEMGHDAFRRGTLQWWRDNPGVRREIEEIIGLGNRTVVRWHLVAEPKNGAPVSQHGAIVFENDGERIVGSWPYYADIAQLMPTVPELK